jgi:ankyrin repeat protein
VVTCKWIFDKGIDFTLINDAGHTSLHKAAWKGHEECLRWMIEDETGPKLAFQLHMRAADGRTAQEKARVNGHTATANWLLSLASKFPPPSLSPSLPGGE